MQEEVKNIEQTAPENEIAENEIAEIETAGKETTENETAETGKLLEEDTTEAIQAMSQESLEALLREETQKQANIETKQEEASEGSQADLQKLQKLIEENALLTKELEKLKKKVEHQDKFFARQATELGLLRKKTPEEEMEELQTIRDLYLEDPIKARERHDKYLEEKKKREEAEAYEKLMEQAKNNYEVVRHYAPNFEDMLDDMVNVIKQDGASEEVVKQFAQMPYVYDPAILLNLYKRAEVTKELAKVISEFEALKKENEELKKKPGLILQRIEEATKHKTITGKSAGTAYTNNLNRLINAPIHTMNMEELKKLIGS